MEFKGSSVYDQSDFLTNYLKRKNREESPNNAIEGPIIKELIGDVSDLDILDVGCGDASFGKELLELGANSYTGVEGSSQMASLAIQNVNGLNGKIVNETMETFIYPDNEYDLVTSRFAIHYIEDITILFNDVLKTLKGNGKFVFSVQHPVTTSSFESIKTGGKRENWIVDQYFNEGVRNEPWIDKVVVKYHRTVEQYFMALRKAGFEIEELREGTPRRENFKSDEEFARRQRIPLVLIFSCKKIK